MFNCSVHLMNILHFHHVRHKHIPPVFGVVMNTDRTMHEIYFYASPNKPKWCWDIHTCYSPLIEGMPLYSVTQIWFLTLLNYFSRCVVRCHQRKRVAAHHLDGHHIHIVDSHTHSLLVVKYTTRKSLYPCTCIHTSRQGPFFEIWIVNVLCIRSSEDRTTALSKIETRWCFCAVVLKCH